MPVIPGDPFGDIKDVKNNSFENIKPAEINKLHKGSDVDVSANSQHHTLGPKANQASPGDHIHNGKTSRPIGYGMGLTVLTSSGTADQKIDRIMNMLKQVMDVTTT